MHFGGRVLAVVFLAACTSSSPGPQGPREFKPEMFKPSEYDELMSTERKRPPEEPPIEIDAEPIEVEPVPEVVIEPEPVPERLACLPSNATPVVTLQGSEARMCFSSDGNMSAPPDTCVWVGAGGKARVGDPPATLSSTTGARASIGADGKSAELCAAGGACHTIAIGSTIQQAIVDVEGVRGAVLTQSSDTDSGMVEIYDLQSGGKIATGTRRWKSSKGKVSYEIAFAGSAILWIEYPGAVDPGDAEIWKTGKGELKKRKSLSKTVNGWGYAGDDMMVFAMEKATVEVWNIKKAKRTLKLTLDELSRDKDPYLQLATDYMKFAVLAQSESTARLAFVDLEAKKKRPEIVNVPVCE